jgi:hypothetical protein
MNNTTDDSILDDLFHGCALRAYIEVMMTTGEYPPACEATRRLAFRYYEEALAAKRTQNGVGESTPGD